MTEYNLEKKLLEARDFIQSRVDFPFSQAIILGSGLGNFARAIEVQSAIPAARIPHYPISTVSGHAGQLIMGRVHGYPVTAVQGRVHFYEGYPWEQVTFSVRLLKRLGVRVLIVTNAAGSMNPQIRPGDLMLIEDHINLFFSNPLMGYPIPEESQRFVDMLYPYDPVLRRLASEAALELGIELKQGVLAGNTGPTYETRAEVNMIRKLGGDAGTMSTIPEVIVAKQEGLKVLGISCITNMATGLAEKRLDHQEVTEVAAQVEKKFQKLITRIMVMIGENLRMNRF